METMKQLNKDNKETYEFSVTITETFRKTVKIMAESYEDAEEKVDNLVAEAVKGYDPANDKDSDYNRQLDVECLDEDYKEGQECF